MSASFGPTLEADRESPRPAAPIWRVVLSYVWALAPLLLALPAAPCIAWAAWRRRSRFLALSAALYGVATIFFWAFAASEQWGGAASAVGLGVMGVATVHALTLRREVFGIADRTDVPSAVPPSDWTPPFPTRSVESNPSDPSTWVLPFGCNGHDRHRLGLDPVHGFGYAASGAALLAMAAWLGLPARVAAAGGGLLLVPVFVAMFRQELDGVVLRYRSWGVARTLRLDEVSIVRIAPRTRGTTLLLEAPDRRPGRIALFTPTHVESPEVREHLLGWLDRPGVTITPEAALLLRPESIEAATTPPAPRGRRLRIAAVVLGLVTLAGSFAVGLWVREDETARRRIPGAHEYLRYAGPDGDLVAVGRPWGVGCMPVRFAVEASVPEPIYQQAAAVVTEARAHGVNVVLETRTFDWDPGSVSLPSDVVAATVPRVGIFADDLGSPSEDGERRYMDLQWDTVPDPDGVQENLLRQQVLLHLPALEGDDAAVRHAFRNVVAFSQGINRTTSDQSGIGDDPAIDAFTSADIDALLLMSGCQQDGGPAPA